MKLSKTIDGVVFIVLLANVLAVIIFSTTRPVFIPPWGYNPKNLAVDSLTFILLAEAAICFGIAALGGFSVPTARLPGDKDPSHYTHDTWTGGGTFAFERPVFLISGVIIFLEAIMLAIAAI